MTEEDIRWLAIDGYKYVCRALWQSEATTDPIVLVPGAFQDMRAFSRIEARLNPVATVVTLDLPGSGSAEPLPSEYGFDFLASALCGALDELGIARANFVGISFSCPITYGMALRYPNRVAKMALTGAAPEVPSWSRPELQEGVRLLRQGQYAEFIEAAIRTLMCTHPGVHIKNQEVAKKVLRRTGMKITPPVAAQYADAIERLLNSPSPYTTGTPLETPTLVISGEHDPYCVPDLGRAVTALIPGSALALFKDADHMLNIECEQELCDIYIRFFTGQSLDSLDYCTHEPGSTGR